MEALYRYWGKARRPDSQEDGNSSHLLVYHSLDVAAVGKVLLEQHPFLLARLAAAMELPPDIAKRWCMFLLGLHDLGKFAESFQQLRSDLREQLWPGEAIRKKTYSLRHDSLGMLLWQQHLKTALFPEPDEVIEDFLLDALPHWLAPVFGHHGWPPNGNDRIKNHFRDFDQDSALQFARHWQALIKPDFETVIEKATGEGWVERQKEASWLLAGIAVLADWIGSNTDFFSYQSEPMPLADFWHHQALPSAERAIESLKLQPPSVARDKSLRDLFDYIDTATPLQQTCAEWPLAVEPQLFILEDVTGAGKTEAALMLAHRLISAGEAEGLYIGLPTMATANAMYERMAKVYQSFYQGEAKPSLILSHGARHLSKAFQQSLLDTESDAGSYGKEESIGAQCNRWLADNRKKALLADVGIGTIDQALLGVMPARHQSLRLLGLANKVLILDEVHAYDAYTAQPLKHLIQFHAALGGSVILLSATLTQQQRQAFAKAFTDGANVPLEQTDYPLLTHVTASGHYKEKKLDTRPSVAHAVSTTLVHDEQAVLAVIRGAVEKGQCVCWIRNTVADAREAWGQLADSGWVSNDDLYLFHSRYAMADRIEIETAMLARFGKDSAPEQRTGRVLIATQVVEQSLDLDFDAMVSDLAPIDLLIQRAGRLHRHQRGERGRPVLNVLTPEPIDDPDGDWYKAMFPKANFVYPDTLVLWRTARELNTRGGWRMPDDARNLLETIYSDDGDCPTGLEDANLAVEGETFSQRSAGEFASLRLESGYKDNDRWDEEATVATRLGDDTQTVYLARWQEGTLSPWRDEGRYPWDLSSLRVSRKQLAGLASIDDPMLQQALETLCNETPLFDEHSLILPLRESDGRWCTPAHDDKGRQLLAIYDETTGMMLERET